MIILPFDYKFRRWIMTPVTSAGYFLQHQDSSHFEDQKSKVCSIQIDMTWHLGVET